MIPRLLLASLRHRGRQLALMVAAVTVAAATVAALAGFALSARSGLGGELAAFGPNLVVRPQVGGPAGLPPAEAARIRALPGVEAAAAVAELGTDSLPADSPELARAALAAGLPVVAAEPELLALHPTWRLHGEWPTPGGAAAGGAVTGSDASP
ncbi:MAG TPA: hypothetical protein VHQ65_08680, partial [Thermoanaerobaculia bacterium]|nr:hypothetical protein [Thermoanaerobaculia bacterium]